MQPLIPPLIPRTSTRGGEAPAPLREAGARGAFAGRASRERSRGRRVLDPKLPGSSCAGGTPAYPGRRAPNPSSPGRARLNRGQVRAGRDPAHLVPEPCRVERRAGAPGGLARDALVTPVTPMRDARLRNPNPLPSPFRAGHDTAHESIERGNGERGVAPAGAPDETLRDQLGAGGAERSRLPVESPGDLPRAMRAGAELRHGPQVALLGGGQAVEAGAEEPRIEGGDHLARRASHVPRADGRSLRDVPGLLAPFLQEIRIAPGLVDDRLQRAGGDVGMARAGGLAIASRDASPSSGPIS